MERIVTDRHVDAAIAPYVTPAGAVSAFEPVFLLSRLEEQRWLPLVRLRPERQTGKRRTRQENAARARLVLVLANGGAPLAGIEDHLLPLAPNLDRAEKRVRPLPDHRIDERRIGHERDLFHLLLDRFLRLLQPEGER